MRKLVVLFGIFFMVSIAKGQKAYVFNETANIETTPVISQGRTGTCWSFSTSSFLESEIIRLTGKSIDLSEMYTVRNTYPLKSQNYIKSTYLCDVRLFPAISNDF